MALSGLPLPSPSSSSGSSKRPLGLFEGRRGLILSRLYIVRLTDGSIGIYDPKDGATRSARRPSPSPTLCRRTSERTRSSGCAAASCGRRRAAGACSRNPPTPSTRISGSCCCSKGPLYGLPFPPTCSRTGFFVWRLVGFRPRCLCGVVLRPSRPPPPPSALRLGSFRTRSSVTSFTERGRMPVDDPPRQGVMSLVTS